MEKIFEIATNISTPLMLAGFLAAAFFLIIHQLLKKDLFKKLSANLSADIIRLIIHKLFILSLVSMLLGFAGFILTTFYTEIKKPFEKTEIKLVKNAIIKTEISSKNKSDRSFWPLIDYQFKNVGEQVGIVTGITLDILEAVVDRSPKLYFQLLPTKAGNLQLRVVNLGWDIAKDVEIEFFSGKLRTILLNDDSKYRWNGDIYDIVVINISKNVIISNTTNKFNPLEIGGTFKFTDSFGKKYENKIEYDSIPRYPDQEWELIVEQNSFSIRKITATKMFYILKPSAKYNVLIDTNRAPYQIEVPVSQLIKPNEGDKFQIILASTKSADYLIRSHIEIDGKKVITTKPIKVSIKYHRLLTSLYYREGLTLNLAESDPMKIDFDGRLPIYNPNDPIPTVEE